jgi:hypothetical protein
MAYTYLMVFENDHVPLWAGNKKPASLAEPEE